MFDKRDEKKTNTYTDFNAPNRKMKYRISQKEKNISMNTCGTQRRANG